MEQVLQVSRMRANYRHPASPNLTVLPQFSTPFCCQDNLLSLKPRPWPSPQILFKHHYPWEANLAQPI